MMHNKNKTSGEVNALSLVVRKYIARHCVTLASHMPAGPLSPEPVEGSKEEQAQTNNNPKAVLKFCESAYFRTLQDYKQQKPPFPKRCNQ